MSLVQIYLKPHDAVVNVTETDDQYKYNILFYGSILHN